MTDEIFSASVTERDKRRGIAGDLVVFKVAGAAAAEGLPLGEVAAMAGRANDRTRTMGVAFSGCTLPGADRPPFTVPPGRMAIGLGIHGEPGFDEVDLHHGRRPGRPVRRPAAVGTAGAAWKTAGPPPISTT